MSALSGIAAAAANNVTAALALARAERAIRARAFDLCRLGLAQRTAGGGPRAPGLRYYIAHVELEAPLKAVVRQGTWDRRSVKRRLRDIEERRECPEIDGLIAEVAEAARCAA